MLGTMNLGTRIFHLIHNSFIFINEVFSEDRINSKISYAQYGEDLIIRAIFDAFEIPKPTYLDIGACEPVNLNNTYLLYTQGSKGVLVEPDPGSYDKIKIKRKRDICLNIGIGVCNKDTDFYIMSARVLNTFSKEEAMRIERYGTYKIEKIIKVQIKTVDDIIQEYFDKCPNFVSLDVEGLEVAILKTFDFFRFEPEVFCIETLTYSEDKSGKKVEEIFEIMRENGYIVYADTNLNTIFVNEKAWINR